MPRSLNPDPSPLLLTRTIHKGATAKSSWDTRRPARHPQAPEGCFPTCKCTDSVISVQRNLLPRSPNPNRGETLFAFALDRETGELLPDVASLGLSADLKTGYACRRLLQYLAMWETADEPWGVGEEI